MLIYLDTNYKKVKGIIITFKEGELYLWKNYSYCFF